MSNAPSLQVATNPYPGLRPFSQNESHLFFGRDQQVDELLRRMRRGRLLAVVGMSGSGKSSLVRAGLLPALDAGMMGDLGADWRIADMRPGSEPIRNLAQALLNSGVFGDRWPDSDESVSMIAAMLRRGDRALVEMVRALELPQFTNLLILADQFEEIFRFHAHHDPCEAHAFVALLLALVRSPQAAAYVVLTMRSDFLGPCSLFQGLPEALNDSQYLCPRLTRPQWRESMEGPAEISGGTVEPRLIQQILNDVGTDPDQLPVVQHALMWMWHRARTAQSPEQHSNGDPPAVMLTLENYRAIGGITTEDNTRAALSRHADEVFDELEHQGRERLVESLFRSLTERGPNEQSVRRPVSVSQVAKVSGQDAEAVIEVVEAFRRPDRCFLTPGAAVPLTADSVIDISHESLIRQWDRLRQWTQDEDQSADVCRRLASSAELHAQGYGELLRGRELEHVLEWRRRERPTAAWAARYLTSADANAPEAGFSQCMDFLDESEASWKEHLANQEQQRLEHERLLADRAEAETRRAEAEAAKAREAEARSRAEQARATEAERREQEQREAVRRQRVLMWILGGAIVLAAALAVFSIKQNRDLREKNVDLNSKSNALRATSLALANALAAAKNTDFMTSASRHAESVDDDPAANIPLQVNPLQKTWPTDDTLRVTFIEPTSPAVKAEIERIAQEWTKYANIRFDFFSADTLPSNSHIRISLGRGGYYSFIGTDALDVPSNRQTMNIEAFALSESAERQRTVTLMQFGHVLGLALEHLNPNAAIKWNKEAVYAFYTRVYGWSKSQVDNHLFHQFPPPYREFDPDSIMMFTFPKSLMLDGSTFGQNTELSRSDKEFVGELYKFGPAADLEVDAPAVPVLLERLHLQRYRFETSSAARYIIQAEGPEGAELSLYGPGNEIDQIAEVVDQANPQLVENLAQGVYYIKLRHFEHNGPQSYSVTVKPVP